jgi:pimeloyl-ACP methyl ester carboxylesterase
MGTRLDLALGILNGTIGDYLARTANPLATPMECIHAGRPLRLERATLATALAPVTGKVVVLIHGLMGTEAHWAFPAGGDYGSMLAQDLGFTPIYLRYNTGQPISENGVALSALLDGLVGAWPVEPSELLLLAHSMGGLVARAACHVASTAGESRWLPRVRRAIYIGTPHRGAPMERAGRVIARVLNSIDDPYARLLGQLADLRSDGIKDLGDADLRPEDRARRTHAIGLRDARHPVPLLAGIDHFLIAGTVSADPLLAALFGDIVVPVASATNGLLAARIIPRVAHQPLAHHPEVYTAIRERCEEPS